MTFGPNFEIFPGTRSKPTLCCKKQIQNTLIQIREKRVTVTSRTQTLTWTELFFKSADTNTDTDKTKF